MAYVFVRWHKLDQTMELLVKYKAIWIVYVVKNDQECIDNKRLRKWTDFRKRHPRFFVRRSVWFYQLIYCNYYYSFKQNRENEIPNAEEVKRVFSTTRPTLFHVSSC